MFIVAPTWGLDASDLAQFIAPLHPSLKGIGVKGNHQSAEPDSPHHVGCSGRSPIGVNVRSQGDRKARQARV